MNNQEKANFLAKQLKGASKDFKSGFLQGAKIALDAENNCEKSKSENVSHSLPEGFWFEDENGIEVTVLGTIEKWCMVEDIEHDEPYVLPFEYVFSLYSEIDELIQKHPAK